MEAAVVRETGCREGQRGGGFQTDSTNTNTQLAVRANTRLWLHTCTFTLALTLMRSAGFTSCDSCGHTNNSMHGASGPKAHHYATHLTGGSCHRVTYSNMSWGVWDPADIQKITNTSPVELIWHQCAWVCMCVKQKQGGSVRGVYVRCFLRSASGFWCAHRPPSRGWDVSFPSRLSPLHLTAR